MNRALPPRSIEEELRIKSAEIDKLKADHALMEAVHQRAEGRLAAMRRTIADLNERLEGAVPLNSHEGAVSDLLNKISVLESTLSQREEEIDQTRRELEEIKRESVSHDAAIEAVRAKLEDANAWVFKLAGERRSAELTLQSAKAERDRVQRENTSLLAEKNAAIEAALQLKERIEREAQEKAAILEALDALGNTHSDLQREVGALRADHSAATTAIRERDAAIEELGSAHSDLQREIGRLQADNNAATAVVVERDVAVAGLEAENRKQDQQMRAQYDMLSWLRLVSMEIRRSHRWWFLLSEDKRGQLLSRRLSQIGLFDGQSYLDRYPDVAEEGMDPLVHYLVHGMREGRQR